MKPSVVLLKANNQPLDILLHPVPHDIRVTERAVLALMSQYLCVTAKNSNDLGHTQVMQHHIDTEGAAPNQQQVRRVPSGFIIRHANQGNYFTIKRPLGISNRVSHKKDGFTQFCVDYIERLMQSHSRRDIPYLCRVDDILDTLSGSTWFSTINLRSGYWQVEMAPAITEKTAFCTRDGLFEFNVMPFGMCSGWVVARVHNRNIKRECQTYNRPCTNTLHKV